MSHLRTRSRYAAVAIMLILALAAFAASAAAADILDQWENIKLPPMPELKPVTLQGPTTALLILDMLTSQCAPNSRCAATVPTIKRLHDEARAAGAMVWYSMPGANTMPADIVDPGLTPRDGEWERVGGPDKFFHSSLEEKLNARGIKTIIVCGHSFQGVGIGTGSASMSHTKPSNPFFRNFSTATGETSMPMTVCPLAAKYEAFRPVPHPRSRTRRDG